MNSLVLTAIAGLDLWMLVVAPNPLREVSLGVGAALQLSLCAAGLCMPQHFQEARAHYTAFAIPVLIWYMAAAHASAYYPLSSSELPPIECILINAAHFTLLNLK